MIYVSYRELKILLLIMEKLYFLSHKRQVSNYDIILFKKILML